MAPDFSPGDKNAAQPRLRGYLLTLLGRDLAATEARGAKPQALSICMADEPDAFRKGLSIAARIGVELVAALIVGGGLGYLADSYFSSSPFGIIIGVFLGMSAGLLNVYRTASRL
jgi:ATP synthase protein I